jgi:uncharacterized protein (DUF1330 family)
MLRCSWNDHAYSWTWASHVPVFDERFTSALEAGKFGDAAIQSAAGGSTDRLSLIGEPPKRFGVSEWESLEKLQAYYNSPERQALNDMRAKAQKVVRQFMVEAPAN